MEPNTPPQESSELSLRLEDYTDIFSDFDMRPFSRRAISVDFLDEVKRAVSEKSDEEIEMFLFMPEAKREESKELVIKERLAAHFKRHHKILLDEKVRILQTGTTMVILGILSMIVATSILSKNPIHENWFSSFLIIFFEPAAWFLWWEGLDQIVFNSKNINPSLNFYRKMSNAHKRIHFKSY